MESRERVTRTLEFKNPDRPPFDLWALPGVWMFRENELNKIKMKYPPDIFYIGHDIFLNKSKRERGTPYVKGTYTDDWGCDWLVLEDGLVGEVKNPPLIKISEFSDYSPPYERLENINSKIVKKICSENYKFNLGGSTVRPFERLQFLLGTEKLFTELAYCSKELKKLIKNIHDYYLKEISLWVQTDVDGIQFMDDWGSQSSLLISPEMFREYFKPLYKEYCEIIHSKNKYVFFHSDGNIESIYPDFIEIGIDAINSQLFCMDMEELSKKYKGKITFWGEIDRQKILPFGTKQDVIDAVNKLIKYFYLPEGGIIAQCEFGLKDPAENIEAVFETWGRCLII